MSDEKKASDPNSVYLAPAGDDAATRLDRLEQWLRAWGRGDQSEQARIWADVDPERAAKARAEEAEWAAMLRGDDAKAAGAGPPPDGPVSIVGEPGWIPPGKTPTTTETVAALQRRYPDDPEVRALIAKVTDNHEEVRAAGDRAARAERSERWIQANVDRYFECLEDLSDALREAAGEGAGPGLDGVACQHLDEKISAAFNGEGDE